MPPPGEIYLSFLSVANNLRVPNTPASELLNHTDSVMRKKSTSDLFYRENQIVNVITEINSRRLFSVSKRCLAEHNAHGVHILAVDENGSVIREHSTSDRELHNYTTYGYASTLPSINTLKGFNGEYFDPICRNYVLGAGYRAFSSTLRRFNSPDNISPFGLGGWNAYTYCYGDPVNITDPSGHSGIFIRMLKGLGNMLGLRRPRQSPTTADPSIAGRLFDSASGMKINWEESTPRTSYRAESVGTRSMISLTPPTSVKRLSVNSSSGNTIGFADFSAIEKIDPAIRTESWAAAAKRRANLSPFEGNDFEITVYSVNESLISQNHGRVKSELTMNTARRYKVGKLYMIDEVIYTGAQIIQRRIRDLKNY